MEQFNTKQGVFGPGGHGGGIFQTTISGLGSMQFNTKEGVFGPGGHGGGIFQTTVAGLGAVDQTVLSLQITANAVLPGLGIAKLTEDGKMGQKTCSAVRAIIASGKYSGWTIPSGCGATVFRTPTVPTTIDYSAPSSNSTGSKLMMAGLGVLIVVGGYYAVRKVAG